MNTLKNIFSKIFTWGKKHNIIAFIIIVMLLKNFSYYIDQAISSFKYGGYETFVKYPSDQQWYDAKAIKLDDNNALFFFYNNGYYLYNLNLKTKKFKKYNTKFNYPNLIFSEKINDKVYLIFHEKEKNQRVFVFDYKTDTFKEILNDDIEDPKKVVLDGKNYIIYGTNWKHTIKLYDIALNKTKILNIKGLDTDYPALIGQLDNGLFIFEKEFKGLVFVDLKKQKVLSTLLDFGKIKRPYIILDNNLLVVIYNQWDKGIKGRGLLLETYRIDKNGKATSISYTVVPDFYKILHSYHAFDPTAYVVLNPETIIFSCGIYYDSLSVNYLKETYLYNFKTKEFKRLTDFYYTTTNQDFLRLDDTSFLMYNIYRKSFIEDFSSLNKIYKFKLKKGV